MLGHSNTWPNIRIYNVYVDICMCLCAQVNYTVVYELKVTIPHKFMMMFCLFPFLQLIFNKIVGLKEDSRKL